MRLRFAVQRANLRNATFPLRYPIRQTNSVAIFFPIPHRPTKLLLAPAACILINTKSGVASARVPTDNRERNLRESVQKTRRPWRDARDVIAVFNWETDKKIPTDKGWDFEYWWCAGNRRQTTHELLKRAHVGW